MILHGRMFAIRARQFQIIKLNVRGLSGTSLPCSPIEGVSSSFRFLEVRVCVGGAFGVGERVADAHSAHLERSSLATVNAANPSGSVDAQTRAFRGHSPTDATAGTVRTAGADCAALTCRQMRTSGEQSQDNMPRGEKSEEHKHVLAKKEGE